MLRSQKLEIKSVEIRGRLSELAGLDSLEEDQRTELKEKTTELRQVEEQRVAALEVEALEERKPSTNGTSPLDPEERERREVLGKARLGNAIRAVIEGRPLQGAEAEVRSAFGLSGDHEIPHELFEPRAATPAPADGPGERGSGSALSLQGDSRRISRDRYASGRIRHSLLPGAHHRDSRRDEGEGSGGG